MKRLALIVGFMTGFAASAGMVRAQEDAWGEQLREMLDLLYRTSALNAVNGLNLTLEQAEDLLKLALEFRSSGGLLTRSGTKLRSDLEEVREVYLELIPILKKGGEVPDRLRKRFQQTRAAEAAAIRETLTWNPSARTGSCARCHASPDPDAGPPSLKESLGRKLGRAMPPQAKKEQVMAHFSAVLSERGTGRLIRLSGKVDAILTEEQKAVLKDFVCCVIPPSELSDPVRVGQAEVSDRSLKLLEFVRKIPERKWPAARKRLLKGAERVALLVKPQLGERGKKAVRERAASIYEEARAMSDIDFELGKADLASRLQMKITSPAQSDFGKKFQAAFFLLGPGAVEAYDGLIERMKKAPKAGEGGTPGLKKLGKGAGGAT